MIDSNDRLASDFNFGGGWRTSGALAASSRHDEADSRVSVLWFAQIVAATGCQGPCGPGL
jgi:hypothetical protein